MKETRIMHSKSDNIKIMMGSETNDIIEKISKKIIKINEKKWVCFWWYRLQKISLKRSESFDLKWEYQSSETDLTKIVKPYVLWTGTT